MRLLVKRNVINDDKITKGGLSFFDKIFRKDNEENYFFIRGYCLQNENQKMKRLKRILSN